MNAIIISLMVLFLHATTWDGMIFEGIKKIIKPEGMLYKPLYGCPICMTPWWGTLIYLMFFLPVGPLLRDWIVTIGAASGMSVIYVVLLSLREFTIEAAKKIEEEENKTKHK